MSATKPELALMVFAKAPVPGAAKTRLIPLLGADGAAALQEKLMRHALATAAAARPDLLELWCTPDAADPLLQTAAALHGATLHTQSGTDLGARLDQAFSETLTRARYALCTGTDCPALQSRHFVAALAALREGTDAVFAPAEDGGYTLIGLARNDSRLFSDIDWGSDRVMQQTREQLKRCGLQWRELETLWDIDRPEDWHRLQRSGLLDDHTNSI